MSAKVRMSLRTRLESSVGNVYSSVLQEKSDTLGKMTNKQRIWVDEKAPIPKILGALDLIHIQMKHKKVLLNNDVKF